MRCEPTVTCNQASTEETEAGEEEEEEEEEESNVCG